MKIELSTGSTFPEKGFYYWQFVILPTISTLRMKADPNDEYGEFDSYVVFNFEWLFWSVTILIK